MDTISFMSITMPTTRSWTCDMEGGGWSVNGHHFLHVLQNAHHPLLDL